MKILPIKFSKQTDWVLISTGVLFAIFLVIVGVATAIKSVADWGAEHQVIFGQRVIDIKFGLPWKVVNIEPKVVNQVVITPPFNELTPIEQKIINKWGYKDGMMAIAIFDCGESHMNQYAVSETGDLGVAQINWHYNGKIITERFGYNTADMLTSIDKNLESAYLVWDRADGKEGNGEGSFSPWSGYNNGRYLNCFN